MKSNKRKTFTEEVNGTVSEIINQVKKLIKKGNARRVIIQNKNGKVLFQTQLTMGLGGAALLTAIAPFVSALGTLAVVMTDLKVVVERYSDDEDDEYEVEAEFVEIRDEEKESSSGKTDKTVGKENDK